MILEEYKPIEFKPVDLEKFDITQSGLRYFYDWSTCKIRWYRQYVLDHEYPPTDVMLKGQVFEHHVIGGTRDGNVPVLPRKKPTKAEEEQGIEGALYADGVRLMELVDSAKVMIDKMGIKVTEVQPEWKAGNLVAHPDCLVEFHNDQHTAYHKKLLAIFDIKYTETRYDDKWNGWSNVEDRPEKWIQPIHYVYVYYLQFGEILPFYYLIFGKSGWVRLLKMEITESDIAAHIVGIQKLRDDLGKFTPKPINKYNTCKDCSFRDNCDFKLKLPEVQNKRRNR